MSRKSSSKSSPLELGDIDLGIAQTPKKWKKEDDDYLFGSAAMKEYMDRVNVFVLGEIALGHIKFKLNRNGPSHITINNKEVFKADYGYNESAQFFYIDISTLSPVYNDKIELRWWINKGKYSILPYFNVYQNNPTANERSLGLVLLMLCVFRSFDTIVDLTIVQVPDFMIRFDYLTEDKKQIIKHIMKELKPLVEKFKEYIHRELTPPDEVQYTDYKNKIGERLVSFITDAYGKKSQGQNAGNRKNVKREYKKIIKHK